VDKMIRDTPEGQTQYDSEEKSMNESFEELALRVWKEMAWIVTLDPVTAFALRIRDELYKGQEPVGYYYRYADGLHTQLCSGLDPIEVIPLYLRPAPIPADMVLVPRWLLKTAQNLAKHMAKTFYPEVVKFDVFDDLAGVVSQIDNMVCGIPTEAMIAAYEQEQGK